MNLVTATALYFFSSLAFTGALPSSTLPACDPAFPKLASALGHYDDCPDPPSGHAPLHARGSFFSKGNFPISPTRGQSQSPKMTYICRNKLPQCGEPHGPFCEKHCECSRLGDISCEKRLPAYPITVRQYHKQEREALCTKACHCEMVEWYPRTDLMPSQGNIDAAQNV